MPTACVLYWILNACLLHCHMHMWFSQLEKEVSLSNIRTKKSRVAIDLWNPACCVSSHLALRAVWTDCCKYHSFLKHLTLGLLNIKHQQEEFQTIYIPYSQATCAHFPGITCSWDSTCVVWEVVYDLLAWSTDVWAPRQVHPDQRSL